MCVDDGIQAAADAIIRNNIVSDAGGDLLHIREHQSAKPGNMLIEKNTFVRGRKGGNGIRVQRPAGGYTGDIEIRNNAIFAPTALRLDRGSQIKLRGNVASRDAGENLDKDLLPNPGSHLLDKDAGARRP